MSTNANLRLLKKSELLKTLNISRTKFEKRLSEGIFPPPFTWVTNSPRGRRWHPDDIRDRFGIVFEG